MNAGALELAVVYDRLAAGLDDLARAELSKSTGMLNLARRRPPDIALAVVTIAEAYADQHDRLDRLATVLAADATDLRTEVTP